MALPVTASPHCCGFGSFCVPRGTINERLPESAPTTQPTPATQATWIPGCRRESVQLQPAPSIGSPYKGQSMRFIL